MCQKNVYQLTTCHIISSSYRWSTWLPILLNLKTLLFERRNKMNLKWWLANVLWKLRVVHQINMGKFQFLFRFCADLGLVINVVFTELDIVIWQYWLAFVEQMYISRGSIDSFSLVSDAAYISSSLARVMRALFEICLRRGWSEMSSFMLEYCKAVDRQIWPHQHPLRQFDKDISSEVCYNWFFGWYLL